MDYKEIDQPNYYISSDGIVSQIINGEEVIIKAPKNSSGYLHCTINKKSYYIHHLVWDYFGDGDRHLVKKQIHHINNNKLDNRIENLELVTNRENCQKRKLNKVEPLGVSKSGRNKETFKATIYKNGKYNHLGTFKTAEEAHLKYLDACKNNL